MLTKAHAIVEFSSGRAYPDRLGRKAHAHYLGYAESMLALYREGIGRARRDLHRSVQKLFADEPDCDPKRIQSFCKLLDDVSEYDTDPLGQAAKLRLQVFAMAAPSHPLVETKNDLFENEELAVKQRIAQSLNLPWSRIEEALYADVTDYHRLGSFAGYPDGAALLARYNVAQVQACLFSAERMWIFATEDFKAILRSVKLARLLHEIRKMGRGGYQIEITGPASLMRQTRRYGVDMAKFLPSLLACKGWRLEADISTRWGRPARLVLSPADRLSSHLSGPDSFDSQLEESFAEKFGEMREGWRLIREGAVVHQGQKVFVPDFVFRHVDGTEVLMEIVGFWTPEYLKAKAETLRQFADRRILVAVPASSSLETEALPGPVYVYKTRLLHSRLLEELERIRTGVGAPVNDE